MGNTVFADGMGFFHKNSNGKGVAPGDVCLSPPPNAPAPVPYGNVLNAKDLKKGSKSVKIQKKPTALENKSKIATSTGDEPGNQGGGVITHKTKGKGVFLRWSNSIKAEGKGVCCHGDQIGQNNAAAVPFNIVDAAAQVNVKLAAQKTEKADKFKTAAEMRAEELLEPHGGKIPKHSKGEFEEWWDKLSSEDLDILWSIKKYRKQIEDQIRAPGGLHEWLMVKHNPKFKRMDFSMREIKEMTTPTRQASGPIPGSNLSWQHTTEAGKTGHGSKRMHNALDAVIEGAKDRTDLLKRLEKFASEWLNGGIQGFPPALRKAIIAVL